MAIMSILAEDPENENYGKIRMYERLKSDGHKCCQARVSAIMDENGLRVSKKRKPNGITKADKEAQASDNLLKGDFTSEKPNEKYITDITQTPTMDGPLYISVIFDCYDNSAWGLEMARLNEVQYICGQSWFAHRWRTRSR